MHSVFLGLGVAILHVGVLSAQERSSEALSFDIKNQSTVLQRSIRTAPGVIVSFDGGKTANDMAAVLDIAVRQRLAENSRQYLVKPGDNICRMLVSVGYPSPCEPFIPVLARLNNRSEKSLLFALAIGESVKLPEIVKYRSAESFFDRQSKDATRSKSLLTYWGDLNVSRVEGREDNLAAGEKYAVEFDAFQIYFKARDDAQSSEFGAAILALKSAYISFDILRVETAPTNLKGGDLQNFRDECLQGNAPAPAFDYRDLSSPDTDAFKLVESGLAKTPAPVKIILVDVPLSKAPNLYPSYGDTEPPSMWKCQWAPFKRGSHHSTHLAGIIASRETFGFRGLSQSVQIYSFPWAKAVDGNEGTLEAFSSDRQTNLAEFIIERSGDPLPLNVFLAAVSFDIWPYALTGGQLPDASLRRSRTLEKRIFQLKPFFVVAAGQAEKDKDPVPISPVSPEFPANLGDWPSVVAVTACGPCGSDVRLMPNANYASGERKFVHVAAPGGHAIPGWVSEESISMSPGTSQASAYVAGIAATMISNFPQEYRDGSELKARLQVTSRPLPLTPFGAPHPDNSKLNAGIVDPLLALLDPNKHWLKQNGKWREVKLSAGTETSIFRDTAALEFHIQPKHIRRVYRMSSGTASQWTLYTDYSLQNADAEVNEVKRWGPLQPKSKAARLFQICDTQNVWLRMEDVDDLIIAKRGLKVSSCS